MSWGGVRGPMAPRVNTPPGEPLRSVRHVPNLIRLANGRACVGYRPAPPLRQLARWRSWTLRIEDFSGQDACTRYQSNVVGRVPHYKRRCCGAKHSGRGVRMRVPPRGATGRAASAVAFRRRLLLHGSSRPGRT